MYLASETRGAFNILLKVLKQNTQMTPSSLIYTELNTALNSIMHLQKDYWNEQGSFLILVLFFLLKIQKKYSMLHAFQRCRTRANVSRCQLKNPYCTGRANAVDDFLKNDETFRHSDENVNLSYILTVVELSCLLGS